jgi:hypothetical protein
VASISASTGVLTFTSWPTGDPLFFVVGGVWQRCTMAAAPVPTATAVATGYTYSACVDAVPGGAGNPCTYVYQQSAQQTTYAAALAAMPALAAGNIRMWDGVFVNSAGSYIFATGTNVGNGVWPTGANNAQRDRRPWARGLRVLNVNVAGSLVATSALAKMGFDTRVECSGNPMEVELDGLWGGTSGNYVQVQVYMDGAPWLTDFGVCPIEAGYWVGSLRMLMSPPAGSHLFQVYAQTSGSNATLYGTATIPSAFKLEETVRQNLTNGIV